MIIHATPIGVAFCFSRYRIMEIKSAIGEENWACLGPT